MPSSLLLFTEPGGGTGVTRALDDAGHEVHGCHTLAAAREALDREAIALAVIDAGVDPGQSTVDPLGAIAAIRSRTAVPILLLDSGRADELECGLDAGADDFLSKPFTTAQLHARIRVTLGRRCPGRDTATDVVTVGGLRIDSNLRQAWLDGVALRLTRREFDLLRCLATRAGQVVTRGELARAVWPERTSDPRRTMDVHLSWLRHKLGGTAAHPRYLHTIRGIGFALAHSADSVQALDRADATFDRIYSGA